MSKLLDEFKGLLDNCSEEEPLQSFLRIHPDILISTFNQGAQYPTVFPKFKLADELIPDFVMVGRRSGAQYASWDVDLVEIEPSILDRSLFNRKKQSTNRLREAEEQIKQWQQWMQVNGQSIFVSLALRELKKKHSWNDHAQFYSPSSIMHQNMLISYRIIIGRRKDFGDYGHKYRATVWEQSNHRVEIVPWDRLLDKVPLLDSTG